MFKNKYLNLLFILLFIVAGYLITASVYPKNLNRYPGFVLLLLVDLYLWSYVKKRVFTYKKWPRFTIGLIYWLPIMMLSGLAVIAYFIPYEYWNHSLRIYLFGLVFAFYTAKIITAIILLASDILKVFFRLFSLISNKKTKNQQVDSHNTISRGRFIENVAYVSGGLILGTMFVGMFRWVHDFRLHTINLQLSRLSSAFQGFKIVQISDLHLGSWTNENQLQQAVDLINEQNPDLVVFTGDLVNYKTEEANKFKDILAQINSKNGCAAILGNHDYGDYVSWPTKQAKKRNLEDLFQFYRDLNWTLLRNGNFTIEQNGERLGIIGVENWSANSRFPQYGNITKATKGLGKVSAKILLSHDPSHWSQKVLIEHPDIDLMLAGHTHGFQFGIEIPGIKWSPAKYMYQHWAGLYTDIEKNQHLYVNRGLGSIGYPGRIGILPEITVITLKA